MERVYLCIDLKSYYASVECVSRGLNPLRARLLVADESRTDKTICLAVSPALKALGVPGRPRLFEARQIIARWEREHGETVDYIIAVPRMAEYERISAQIYAIYLRYAAPEDIHVYSIDECFVDCTPYLSAYRAEAERQGRHPAHVMAMTMIRDVLASTGITATAGLGANLYLAKVAMDIVAKRAQPDADGVRIAELNEDSYKYLLWEHRPLTDFWQIGPGKARRLAQGGMFTMGEVAERSLWDEEWFYQTFGIDGELLIDHAWGIEPVTMADIKRYRPSASSLNRGQVLPRPYAFGEARLVFSEMAEDLCAELFRKNLVSRRYGWWASYDWKSLEAAPDYAGPVCLDFYGRLHPKHTGGTVRLRGETNAVSQVTAALLEAFDARCDKRLLFRKLGIAAEETKTEEGDAAQLDLFVDPTAQERERRLSGAMQAVRARYGAAAIFKARDLLEGATALERLRQIGGHRA